MRAINKFHIQYERDRIWESNTWLGVPCWKLPFDLQIMQEVIFKVQPDYLVETGTGCGGSALFFASVMELIGRGKVITVDIEPKVDRESLGGKDLYRKRVEFIVGNSTDKEVLKKVKKVVGGKIIVVLDSWHTKEHVLQELMMYSPMVTMNSYLIVEDTHVNGHPVPWGWGAGPFEAVGEFLLGNRQFIIDRECEKFGFTFNPSGFLKRIGY